MVDTRTEAPSAQLPPGSEAPKEQAPNRVTAIIVGVVIAAVASLSIYYLVRGQPLLV
jgi:hypothetical protein